MYAVIDENKQLKEASPGITRDLAMVALAGKLPNVSFKKQKNLYNFPIGAKPCLFRAGM